ncbi:hypothetical protein LINPERHAP1_LOCUS8260, partial [Linum perenne]
MNEPFELLAWTLYCDASSLLLVSQLLCMNFGFTLFGTFLLWDFWT